MTRLCLIAFCVAVHFASHIAVAQQQPNDPMPPAAANIVGQMDKEILASKKKAVDSLEKVLRDTTKKGDLAGAMAVKTTLDRLNAEIAATGANRGGRGAGDIIGVWQAKGQHWSVEFFADGSVTCTDGGGMRGTWAINGTSVEAVFNNGVTHIMERAPDGWAGFSKHNSRTPVPVRYTRAP